MVDEAEYIEKRLEEGVGEGEGGKEDGLRSRRAGVQGKGKGQA